jgi:hypothetical protein
MATDPKVLDQLRAVADAAGIKIDDTNLETVAPHIIALLERPPGAPPRNLGETEPAFGLRLTKD